MADNKFTDPFDELAARYGQEPIPISFEQKKEPVAEEVEEDPIFDISPEEIDEASAEDEAASEQEPEQEIDYGDDDLKNQIEAEEKARAEERAAAIAAEEQRRKENAPKPLPPSSLDPVFQANSIAFETNKLAIVTTMANKVIAKHHLVSGGIPENIKNFVMGELIDEYYRNGEVITERFEKLILDNWEGGKTTEQVAAEEAAEATPTEQPQQNVTVQEVKPEPAIQINVEPNQPVTVNIDGETFQDVERERAIKVVVREVDETEMNVGTVIENSQLEGIITPYENTATDVPIVLPMSAYRCTMSGASMFDIFKLSSIQSTNGRDTDLKTWMLIYSHQKNVSICGGGKFATFDDFMKHTDVRDQELLLWAMFVATADEEETVHFKCGNKDCNHTMTVPYNPRSIIHINPDLVPAYYGKTETVPPGKAALDHWNEVHGERKVYELPDSKVEVEIDNYSAYDYHQTKMPILQEVYERYRPDDPGMTRNDLTEEEQSEMAITLLLILNIKSVTIKKDGKRYRYTAWRTIEKIITEMLGNKDLGILIAIVKEIRDTESPASFYMENVECPKCGRKDDRIPVDDIMRSLFFPLLAGLANTSISFEQMPRN